MAEEAKGENASLLVEELPEEEVRLFTLKVKLF
jgi:hypothetical protein